VSTAAKASTAELREGLTSGLLQFKHKYGGQVGKGVPWFSTRLWVCNLQLSPTLSIPGNPKTHNPARPTPNPRAPQVGMTFKLVLGGSDSQRLLVACMRRAEETRLMMAVDHKGRLAYANTGLATLLGFKLPALRAREFTTLLPPPYNVLHTKWLKVLGGRGWSWALLGSGCGRTRIGVQPLQQAALG
jgi:hypothetical protein